MAKEISIEERNQLNAIALSWLTENRGTIHCYPNYYIVVVTLTVDSYTSVFTANGESLIECVERIQEQLVERERLQSKGGES